MVQPGKSQKCFRGRLFEVVAAGERGVTGVSGVSVPESLLSSSVALDPEKGDAERGCFVEILFVCSRLRFLPVGAMSMLSIESDLCFNH